MLRHLFFVFLLLSSATAQAFTFKIATLSSDGSVWMQKMRAGAKEISERTEKGIEGLECGSVGLSTKVFSITERNHCNYET